MVGYPEALTDPSYQGQVRVTPLHVVLLPAFLFPFAVFALLALCFPSSLSLFLLLAAPAIVWFEFVLVEVCD